MKPSQGKAMSPLLRSIAREIVERTAAIAQLESRLESSRGHACSRREDADQIAPRLASHRRELRQAEAELRRLGWKRDELAPLRFSRTRGEGIAWQPEETAFYLALGLSWST